MCLLIAIYMLVALLFGFPSWRIIGSSGGNHLAAMAVAGVVATRT
jgi:hypothetical protein